MTPRSALWLFLALTVAALAATFGLSARRADTPPPQRYPDIDWRDVEDDASRRLELTWMGTPTYPTATGGQWTERAIEERFNVELDPIFIDGNAFQKRKPLMFSGGTVPDVYWVGDPVNVQRDVYHGFALEVPYDVILKWAPDYARLVNELAPEAWLYSYWDGANYGVPTFMVRNLFPVPPLWRMDWLRNVGLDRVPRTLDEMREAFRRFRREAPDGNGVRDTYGLSPHAQAWWLAFSEIFGAFGVLPYDWMERDGEVVWGGLLPETREALATLRDWYEEELIDPDFVTEGGYRKFLNGQIGYLFNYGEPRHLDREDPNSLASTLAQLQPSAELAVGNFVVGPDGHRGARIWGAGGHIIMFGAHLARTPEKVLRVLKMFNAFVTDKDLFVAAVAGKRGEHWEHEAKRGIYLLPPYDQRMTAQRNLLWIKFDVCRGFYAPMGAPIEWVDEFMPADEAPFRARYRKQEWGLKDIFGKPDVVPSSGEYLNDLREMQKTVFAEIIRGDRDLSYFDTFVRNWKAQGGDILLEEARRLRRAQKDIYRKMGVDSDATAPTGAQNGVAP